MAYFVGLVAVAIFALLLRVLGAINAAQSVLLESKGAAAIISNTEIPDEQKEARLQKASLAIFSLFFKLVVISAIALCIPGFAIWLLDFFGLLKSELVTDTMLSWHFLMLATVLSILAFIVPGHKKAN